MKDGPPKITGQWRPNAPRAWVHSNANVTLVWHHVLPFNRMRDVWNELLEQCHDTQLAEARTALRQYLLLCDKNLSEVDRWIDRIRRDALDAAECDHIAGVAVWPSWNVVEGPAGRFRSDDPGDGYIDRYTHGLTWLEYGRMKAIEALYNDLAGLPVGGNVTGAALRSLADIFQIRRGVLACDAPIPFRMEMWERDAAGLWRKRRSGGQFVG